MALLISPLPKTLQLNLHFWPVKSKTCRFRHSMFLNTKPVIKDGFLRFNGQDALKGMPENVVATPSSDSSLFLGATFTHSSCRHVFNLGFIEDARLLCLFRFKMWWMIPRVGISASDIPIETQMLLLEAKDSNSQNPNESSCYVVFLPVLDGVFRSSLQGTSANELQVCVETGDPAVVASESLQAVFVNYGNNPFDLMKESMKILQNQIGTFAVKESKQMPGILDWFGWCTWDAFYTDVNPQGIKDGLKSLSEGGTPARFIIIDDGWQDTTNDFVKDGELFVEGSQFGARLQSLEENNKFRTVANETLSTEPYGLKEFVSDIKKNFGLKYIYVWHALMGYWGGLHLDEPKMKKYNPEMKFPQQSPGNLAHKRDIALDAMEKYGIGAINNDKIFEFYDDLHGYLASQGVDGVKVDVQNILETIATGSGGRVSLTRHVQQALEESIAANFQDNSIICCMGLNTDTIYNSRRSSITRASDDYYPKNPSMQTLHIDTVAYNSIFLGEIIIPDWDMFYSLHYAAEFHAAARAIGGCAVYVSDKPGHHDFKILKRLVLPDGSILRAKYPGRPSRDCLFIDTVADGRSLLKIWNLNKCTGVIGAFNCQGAGSWLSSDDVAQNEAGSHSYISGLVSPADIEYFEEISGKSWSGDCAVYSFNRGSLSRLPKEKSWEVTLKTLQCDVFTVSPIKVYYQKIQFAPIGLIDMYNSGGAIEHIDVPDDSSMSTFGIRIKGRGAGRFGAYSNAKPKFCSVNSSEVEFEFTNEDGLLSVTVPSDSTSWEIIVYY